MKWAGFLHGSCCQNMTHNIYICNSHWPKRKESWGQMLLSALLMGILSYDSTAFGPGMCRWTPSCKAIIFGFLTFLVHRIDTYLYSWDFDGPYCWVWGWTVILQPMSIPSELVQLPVLINWISGYFFCVKILYMWSLPLDMAWSWFRILVLMYSFRILV